MKCKELESRLSRLRTFKNPKLSLEQYATPPEIAAILLHQFVHMSYDDVENRNVADIGCGCGVLSIGAAFLGAGCCHGFDIDGIALNLCTENLKLVEVDCCLIQIDTKNLSSGKFGTMFETVLMNPPFGTKNNEGIDMLFLEAGLSLLVDSGVLYSFHKSSCREYISKKKNDLNVEAEVLTQLRFNLPATYRFHRQNSKDIEVDVWRFVKSSS